MSQSRKFFLLLIAFLLPLVPAFVYVETQLSLLDNGCQRKWAAWKKDGQNAEILILGSSHAWKIPTEGFSRPALNMALPSQSLAIDEKIFSKFAPKMPKLQTLVLTVSYFSFQFLLSDSPEKWRQYFYTRFLGLSGDGPLADWLDLRNWSLYYAYGPPYSQDHIRSLFRPEPPAVPQAETAATPTDEYSATERLKWHHIFMKEKHISNNFAVLDRIIRKAHQRNVQVVLVTAPVSAGYRKLSRQDVWTQNTEMIAKLVARDPARTHYFDWAQSKLFGPKDLLDQDHLNPPAALRMAKMLNTEIETLSPSTRRTVLYEQ